MPRSSQSVFRQAIFLQTGDAMDVLWGIVVGFGHAIEQVLVYVESHHWIFGFAALGYIFYLHDRSLHARFDALDKRIDEIRKRLAVEY
jgi:tetrahydromethanopterin S-methyltransferase subunit G